MILYSRRNIFALIRLLLTDLFCLILSFFFLNKKIGKFNNILIANPSHLGDLVISSHLVDLLNVNYPKLKIDFLCGSWGKDLVSANSNISNVFTIDLPSMNRGNYSTLRKFVLFIRGVKNSFALLRAQNYDCIFSVYSFSPSYIPLLWALRVSPVVGYRSAGYGPLLTLKYSPFEKKKFCHEIEYQLRVFDRFISLWALRPNQSSLKAAMAEVACGVELPEKFVLIHPGSGDPNKEWSIDGWKMLIRRLCLEKKVNVVITGHGFREREVANYLSSCPSAFNLVGCFDLLGFAKVISMADLVIGVDSLACHLAGALEVKSISILSKRSNISRWRPMGHKNTILLMDDFKEVDALAGRVLDTLENVVSND